MARAFSTIAGHPCHDVIGSLDAPQTAAAFCRGGGYDQSIRRIGGFPHVVSYSTRDNDVSKGMLLG